MSTATGRTTTPAAATVPTHSQPGRTSTCPQWCNPTRHSGGLTDDGIVHHSDPRTWVGTQADDTPHYSAEFYRADEWAANEWFAGELHIGTTDMTVTVTGGWEWDWNDAEDVAYIFGVGGSGDTAIALPKTPSLPRLIGSLTADDARDFARWLTAMADEIDPHRTNGEPDEWVPGCGGIDGD